MTPKQSLRNVFVTGAGAGIGRAVVERLQRDGYKVLAGLRTTTPAWNTQSKGVTPVVVDITDDTQIDRAARQVDTAVGEEGLHGLVNAAGIVIEGPLELTPVEDFRRQLDVNVTGRFAITRALLPALRRAEGRIVNIGAVSGRTTVPFFACPAVASNAFAALNDAMRMEFAPFGIQVALVEPGASRTEIFDKAFRAQASALERQSKELVDIYAPALRAARDRFSKSERDAPEIVVRAVMRALEARGKPTPRVLVGRGASTIALLGRLPIRLRDPLLMSSIGVAKPMADAARKLRLAKQ